MSLTLSDRELKGLDEVRATLLSVLDEPVSPDRWCREVVERVGTLFRSDWTVFLLRHRDGLELELHPEPRPSELMVRQILADAGNGTNGCGGEEAGSPVARRGRARLEIWATPVSRTPRGRPMKEMPFYDQDLLPSEVLDGGGPSLGLLRGEATLCTVPGAPADDPCVQDWLDLARLILPSFDAAVCALRRRQICQSELLRAFDRLGRPLLIAHGVNGEPSRNRALEALLSRCPEPEALVDEAKALLRCMSLLRRPPSRTSMLPPPEIGEREVTLDGMAYRLRGLQLRPGIVGRRKATVVEVEGRTPLLPSEKELQEGCDLTPRQAEVALLLARGASNREAGEALGISPHTVRTHAQHLFQKLGVHTRKALALRLMPCSGRGSVERS